MFFKGKRYTLSFDAMLNNCYLLLMKGNSNFIRFVFFFYYKHFYYRYYNEDILRLLPVFFKKNKHLFSFDIILRICYSIFFYYIFLSGNWNSANILFRTKQLSNMYNNLYRTTYIFTPNSFLFEICQFQISY